MIKLCPLMAFRMDNLLGGEVRCLGAECALADEGGKCLIRQFLELQVSKSLKEKEAAGTYWVTKKDGTRQPVAFFPISSTKNILIDNSIPDNETPEFKPPRHC